MSATQSTLEFLSARLFPSRKPYLSFRAAAEESSLSERSLRRLHQQGKLEARRVGRRLVIPRESFDQLLQSLS